MSASEVHRWRSTSLLGQPGVRAYADRDQHGVRVERGPVGQHYPVVAQVFDLRAEPELDAVRAMQIREHLCQPAAQDALQGERGGLQHSDRGAAFAGGGGDLQADPAGADDHQPGAVLDRLGDPVRVGECAQRQRVIRARDRQ
jgi:hypothetical protein